MSGWERARLAGILLVTAVCLGWVLWGIDVDVATEALATFRWAWLLPMLVLYTVNFVVRSWRFGLLLEQHVPLRGMMSVVAVSFLAINVVPLRMGELVRPWLLAERHDVPFGAGMAALVVERLLDLIALLVMLGIVALTVDVPASVDVGGVDLFKLGQNAIGAAVGVGVVGVAVLAIVGAPAVNLLTRLVRPVSPWAAEKVEGIGLTFVTGLGTLSRKPLRAAGAIAATACIWILTLSSLAGVMVGFRDVDPSWDLVVLNWTGAITGMVLLPTPGFFGGFEAGSVGTLVLMGVDIDVSRTLSLVMHFAMFGHTVAVGLLFMVLEGISLFAVVQASREAKG